jgi:hypothetical protein
MARSSAHHDPRDWSMTKQPRGPPIEYRPRSAEAVVHAPLLDDALLV